MPIILDALLGLVVGVAAAWDLRCRRVPNWVTVAGVLFGIGLNTILFRAAGLLASLEGAGLALLIYVPLYLLRAIGGGDLKLMAAVGAIVGPANWLRIFILTAVFGAAFAIIVVIRNRRLKKTLYNMGLILSSIGSGQAPYRKHPELDVRSERGIGLPHAVAIACGTVAFLLLNGAGIPL